MKKYLLPLILILLLTFILIGNTADLYGTYDKRIKITIDNTKIDSALSDFPVTVFFTSTQAEEIFTEFDADSDYMKGAFTASDGTTQLYAECELFDDSEQKAIYHVKVTSIASGADTDIYFYYDNDAANNTTYIGAINTTAGGNVWDANFELVYHMKDATTSTIVDSTGNSYDGTKKAVNEPNEVTGSIATGQDFDGSDDYITIASSTNLDYTYTAFTVDALVKGTGDDTIVSIRHAYTGGNDYGYRLSCYDTRLGRGSGYVYRLVYAGMSASVYHVATSVWDTSDLTVYVDGGSAATMSAAITISYNASYQTKELGARSPSHVDLLDGILDEFRISSTNRSAAWIAATSDSLLDGIFTYGSEETSGEAEDNSIFFGMTL